MKRKFATMRAGKPLPVGKKRDPLEPADISMSDAAELIKKDVPDTQREVKRLERIKKFSGNLWDIEFD
ncbi:MAG: hypothetical protein QG589_480 [Patescibacteria group bacterium]|nr:hypothetical protein [Patescibacteria group bacterium]